MKSNRFTLPLCLLLTVPMLAQGQEELLEPDGGPVLEAYANDDDALQILLGAGGRLDNGVGYIYLSHFKTEGRASATSQSRDAAIVAGEQRVNDYRSTRLGFYAEGHDRDTGEGFGGGLFLYNNVSDVELDRYGAGVTMDLAHVVADRFRLYAGFDLMPGFLSTDWSADAALEYEWHAGARVLITQSVDIGIQWRAGRTWDPSYRTRQYEDVMAGLRIAF